MKGRKEIIDKIIGYAEEILLFSQDMDEEDFIADSKTYAACYLYLIRIGGHIRHLGVEYTELYPNVPWEDLSIFEYLISVVNDRYSPDYIWRVIKEMLPLLISSLKNNELNLPDIIFSFQVGPSCFHADEVTSRNFAVLSDSTIKYTARNGHEHIVEEKTSYICPLFLDNVERVLTNRWNIIMPIKEHLDNGDSDGMIYEFQFLNKKIWSLNISKVNLEKIKVRNLPYYQEYKENLENGNLVLDIFHEVLDVFETHNIPIEDPVLNSYLLTELSK